MAGYTRQSTYTDGDIIQADDSNNEFDQLETAFNIDTGHAHDGSSFEGPIIKLIGDPGSSALNKVEIDTSNNRVGFFVNVSSSSVEQVRVQDGVVIPVTNDDVDLGSVTNKFKDGYFSGDLSVGGTTTFVGDITFGEIDSDFIPNADNTYDLGSSTKEWKDLYLDGTANIDTLTADSGTVAGSAITTLDNTQTLTNKSVDLATNTFTGTFAQFNSAVSDATLVSISGAETLTNKTLTSPDINFPDIDGGTVDDVTFTTQDDLFTLEDQGDTTKKAKFEASGISTATTRTFSFPNASGTFLLEDNTAALTDKTIDLTNNTVSGTLAEFNTALSDGSFASLAGAETLTNKTINSSNNTVTLDLTSANLSGTLAQFNSAVSDATLVSLSGTETLTNKTLTSPDVDTPNIDGGTIDGTTIGGTTPAAVTGTTGQFNTSLGVTGDITVTGTVDGRDVASDGSKLDGIESGATADQTASEIKTAYESNADTNAFTDAEQDKLSGIETGADVTDTTNVTAAGALMDSEVTNLADVKAFDPTDYATSAQGDLADTAVQPNDSPTFSSVAVTGTVDGRNVSADGSKLDGIESNATADQTASEIKAAYESNADTNAFTDSEKTKLSNIEANADVTDTTNVTAAGALMDSELTSEASVKGLDQGVATTDSPEFDVVTATSFIGDGSQLTGLPPGYTDADVDAHLNQSTATADQVLTWDGSDYAWVDAGGGGFAPTTVSGTSQALDLGSFNFFDAGTLTADTTISFTNVPTEARWSYTFIGSLLAGYSIENASYDSVSFDVSGQESAPQGIFFKDDGTKMYMVGSGFDSVRQYSLSSAWDLSTASYDSVSLDVGDQDGGPTGIFFKDDGTKMYMVGFFDISAYQYSLSSAWDLSTASYDSVSFQVDASGQEGAPKGIFFKDDGTKMFIVGSGGDSVYQYSLSSAWDLSTASYDSVSFDVSGQDITPGGIFFKDDGIKMFMVGSGSDSVYQYSLSSAWDLSTASYDSVSFDVSGQESSPQGIFFKDDGTKMFIVGSGGDSVYQYTTGSFTTITLPASIQNPPTDPFTTEKVTYEFYTLDGGTNVYLINEEVL